MRRDVKTERRDLEHLRGVLKRATGASHADVDALYSTLDLTLRGDYTRFLASNLSALSALPRAAFHQTLIDHIAQSIADLQADLGELGDKSPPVAAINHDLAPIGVQYVLAGASFGKRVLKARWARSQDQTVLRAGRYLTSKSNEALWQEFLSWTKLARPDSAEEVVIVGSANATFELFKASFHLNETYFA